MKRKHFLVLHEKAWMKNELTPNKRVDKHCTFVFATRNFKDAKYIETKDGTKIDEAWFLQHMIPMADLKPYDGLVLILEGERLKGRNGVHTKKLYNNKRFSFIQIEAKKGWYRTWKEKHNALTNAMEWIMVYTKSRKAGNIKQIVYTFDHEIGHALSWLYGINDILHAMVRAKRWEEYWDIMDGLQKFQK